MKSALLILPQPPQWIGVAFQFGVFYHCSQGIMAGTMVCEGLQWWDFSISMYFPIYLD